MNGRKWQERFPDYHNLFININITQKQFSQVDFIHRIRKVLRESWLDPSYLHLEITENALMQNAESMIDILYKLRDLGVGLHIDDFGEGYSSLSYLQQFPIDTLKIDYSFINRIGTNGDRAEIARTILILARELGLDTIAEGIETENQLQQLREFGCHYGQGYFIGKPIHPENVYELLQSQWKISIPIELDSRMERNELSIVKVNSKVYRAPYWPK